MDTFLKEALSKAPKKFVEKGLRYFYSKKDGFVVLAHWSLPPEIYTKKNREWVGLKYECVK